MASLKKYKQEQAILSSNPELIEIVKDVNYINQAIEKMLRSEYFRGIALPEYVDRLSVLKQAKEQPQDVKDTLFTIKQNIQRIWNERRNEEFIDSKTGIAKSGDKYIKTLSILPESAIKRSEKSKRGTLSEKAVRTIIADDITLLKRLTKKSESEIMEFLNAWYESVDVSGGQLLNNFVDAVYQRDYSGVGASQIWGSPVVKDKVRNQIFEVEDIEPEYTEEFEESYETESKMNDDLYSKWMKLFN